MGLLEILAILLTLTAIFGFINEQTIKLPTPIGVMLVSLLMSLALVFYGTLADSGEVEWARAFLASLNFNELVLEGMLSFLLFAGALHVKLEHLRDHYQAILSLATVGILASTFAVGGIIYLLLGWLGLGIPFIYALLFGSLISPTDPIAVMGILRKAKVPKDIETLITGESLFNDGVGVVVFSVILGIASADSLHNAGADGPMAVLILFAQEAVGGVIFGLILGLIAYVMLKRVDNYTVEILITLATVTGGYALALALHTSGPLAMVVAGLMIGNSGRQLAMSASTREHLDTFWELLDEILNAVLFVLIGLEVLVVNLDGVYVIAALLTVPLVLAVRFVSVSVPIGVLRLFRDFTPYTVRLMTWGGLRGGISIALALAIPEGEARDLLLVLTYAVVIFSILVQGLTVGRLAAYGRRRSEASPRV